MESNEQIAKLTMQQAAMPDFFIKVIFVRNAIYDFAGRIYTNNSLHAVQIA